MTHARNIALTLLAFAIVFIALQVFSYLQKSAVYDEPIHLTAGYSALVRHDYRNGPDNLPLMKMLSALPLLFMPGVNLNAVTLDDPGPPEPSSAKYWGLAHQFIYVDNDADRLIYAARFMMVLLGVALGVLLFFWLYEWQGFMAAILGLALYTVEPNLLANSSLATTDFGVALLIFGCLYFAWRVMRNASITNIAGMTAFFSLAVISKFSALLLGPMIGGVLIVLTVGYRTMKPAKAFVIAAVLVAAAWLSIWGLYGFRYLPSDSNAWSFHFQDDPFVAARVPAVAAIVNWVDRLHLVPNAFIQGFLVNQMGMQERGAFLAGRYSAVGWWYYFPVVFLIKTPIAVIVLFTIGVILSFKNWKTWGRDAALFLMLPVALFLGPAMATHINIGVRHILPIYPFVIMLGAAAGNELAKKNVRSRAVLAVLGVIYLLEFGRAYPDTLAFFNQFVGGPDNGARYLVDSNLDWGQDLKPLKKWMDRNGVDHINLAYFGSADPAYYKINCTLLPGSDAFVPGTTPPLPGYVAVSATILQGPYFTEAGRQFYKPLREREPVAKVGRSIYVYRVERPWW